MSHVKRIILISLAAFALYYGGQIYVATRMYKLMPQCYDSEMLANIDKKNVLNAVKIKDARQFWSCIKEKQTFVDGLLFRLVYFKVPETWLVQPTND
jgi:hypothetical protein